jgi:hypothetical protein
MHRSIPEDEHNVDSRMSQEVDTTGLLSHLSDTHLLLAIAHKQTDALAEVYERYGATVYAAAQELCGPRRGVEITRTAFLMVWSSPNTYFSNYESLLAGLMKVVQEQSTQVLGDDARPDQISEGLERIVSFPSVEN